MMMSKRFLILLLFPIVLCACGKSGYLSEEEHNRIALTLQRVEDTQTRFAEKSKWTAQVALKVLMDVQQIIEQQAETIPANRKTEFESLQRTWRTQTLKAISFGKNMESKPLYNALDSALEQSKQLLETMIEWDQ